jgi:prolyl-tRNA synthetase
MIEEFKQVLEDKGGFVSAHWDGSAETEEKIKDLTKATVYLRMKSILIF